MDELHKLHGYRSLIVTDFRSTRFFKAIGHFQILQRTKMNLNARRVALEEKRGVCNFRNDWILSCLGQHATITFITMSSHCGQVIYVS
jgi:hypothetical protein